MTTSLFRAALLLLGASGIYLYVVAWSFRASRRQIFSLPWLLLPLGGALLAGVTLALSDPASPATPVSLRLLEVLAHCFVILLLWIIVGKIAPAYRLAGTCLYAWNPLVLIELAMYANTAGVVTCLLLLAVLLLLLSNPSSSFAGIIPPFRRGGRRLRRPRPPVQANSSRHHKVTEGDASVPTEDGRAVPDIRGVIQNAGDASVPTPAPTEDGRLFLGFRFSQIAALVLVGLAMRINFMTLLLAPLLIWFMVRHRRGVGAALMGFAWRALVALGVFVVAFLPGWRGIETFLAITNGLRLFDFANSPLSLVVAPTRAFFKFVAERAHFPPLMQPDMAANMTVLATAFFLFALLYFREMGRVRARIRQHIGDAQTIPSTRPDPSRRPVGIGGRVGWMWGPCACPRANKIRLASDDTRQVAMQQDEGTEHIITEESWGEEDRHTRTPKPSTLPPIHPLSLQDGGRDTVGLHAYDALFTGWAVVIVGYVVLAATVFLPGYLVWGVWVVALRRFDALSVSVLLLSCSVLLYYPLQWFALAATGSVLPLCVFGIPLVYLVVQCCLPAGRMERKKVLR